MKHLEPISQCPFCAFPYGKEDTRHLASQGGRDIFHASCLGCRRNMLFAVEQSGERVACFGLFTDCDVLDAERFLRREKITLDDVLRVHELLAEETFSF